MIWPQIKKIKFQNLLQITLNTDYNWNQMKKINKKKNKQKKRKKIKRKKKKKKIKQKKNQLNNKLRNEFKILNLVKNKYKFYYQK